MPELIGIYEDHAEHRDKFEIIAFHDQDAPSFEELDKKLESIKKKYWQGKDLPFPILLDASGKTIKDLGVNSFPTGLLIDPDGKLITEATPKALERKLPKLPASKMWARHRNMAKNISWEFSPGSLNLDKFKEYIARWASVEIEIDPEAIKSVGLTTEEPLPTVIHGVGLSLRSLDDLILAPVGLGVVPSADDKKLLITRRRDAKEADSYFQTRHNKELLDSLDHAPDEIERRLTKPIQLEDAPLFQAVKQIARERSVAMALDGKAIRDSKLDPNAKVTGVVGEGTLRESLTKLLDPLGLTFTVRNEVILISPK